MKSMQLLKDKVRTQFLFNKHFARQMTSHPCKATKGDLIWEGASWSEINRSNHSQRCIGKYTAPLLAFHFSQCDSTASESVARKLNTKRIAQALGKPVKKFQWDTANCR